MTRSIPTMVLLAAIAMPSVAGAQNPQPAPPTVQPVPVAPPGSPSPPPERIAPAGADTQADNQTLSDRLSRQRGTLHPPASVDPGINIAPPAQGTMPVIPPPGSPGGDQRVVPK